MSLRFVLGRAGTGKTEHCLCAIADRVNREGEFGPPLILLVPEQASYQMERALLERLTRGSTQRAQVLSFRRLAYRVLHERGGAMNPPISDLGKQLMLRAILSDRQGDLPSFQRTAQTPGFIERLARTLRELKAHGIEPEQLEQAAASLSSAAGQDDAEVDEATAVLRQKCLDLAAILRAYDDAIAERFSDPDTVLQRVARQLPETRYLRGAGVWVDGFAGFTPSELLVLEQLLAGGCDLTVALCLDSRGPYHLPPAETALFRQTTETFQTLTAIAQRVGADIKPPLCLDDDRTPPRFRQSPDLARIEADFFRPGAAASARPAQDVTVIAAADPQHEVEAIAAEIWRLRREQGVPFREMAVIARRLDPYEPWLRRIFRDYRIPFFIDRRRDVGYHPLVELIRSALEVVAGDWQPDPLFRFLKTDLVPVPREAVDRLERYVRMHGLHGYRAYHGERWTYRLVDDLDAEPPAGEDDVTVDAGRFDDAGDPAAPAAPSGEAQAERFEQLHKDRIQCTGALLRFAQQVAEAQKAYAREAASAPAASESPAPAPSAAGVCTVRALTGALYDLLEHLQVPATLQRWQADAEAGGRVEEAREHRQVWQGVVDLFDQLVQMLGERPVTPAEYRHLLETGLGWLRSGLIPPALDQVLIGSIERSRQPDLHTAFLLGVNEERFPAVPDEDHVLPDDDRLRLRQAGLTLAADSRERLVHERYLTYIALTRPRRRLILTYSRSEGGKPLQPSPIIRRLQALFSNLEPQRYPECLSEPAAAQHPRQLLKLSVRTLADAPRREGLEPGDLWPTPAWQAAAAWLERALPRRMRALYRAQRPQAPLPPLPAALIDRFDGQRIHASVSRLESFASCPFQHFARYRLRLREPDLPELDARRQGNFLHAALRRLVQRAVADPDWPGIDLERQRAWVDEVAAELAPRLHSASVMQAARHRYLLARLKRQLRWSFALLLVHAQRSRFRPVALEAGFGLREPGSWPPYAIDVDGLTLLLRGRIDRIDACEIDGRRWLRIIDYKRSAKAFRLDELYAGINLQLPLYLAVALKQLAGGGEPPLPAGFYFMSLQEPRLEEDTSLDALAGEAPAAATGDEGPDDGPDGPLLTPAKVRKAKLNGLTVADLAVAQALDGTLEPGASSDLLPVAINQNGAFSKASRVAARDDLLALAAFAEQKARDLVREIRRGRIDVAPYRFTDKNRTMPCNDCPYKPVCRVEFDGEQTRYLEAGDDDKIWQAVRAAAAGGAPGSDPAGGEHHGKDAQP